MLEVARENSHRITWSNLKPNLSNQTRERTRDVVVVVVLVVVVLSRILLDADGDN